MAALQNHHGEWQRSRHGTVGGRPLRGGRVGAPRGAEDTLVFYFLISRRSEDIPGMFTFSELRDFHIGGQAYTQLSRARLGEPFEPETVFEEVSAFRTTTRPDLAALISVPRRTDFGLVMYTAISGMALPPGTVGDVTIDVGWGQRTENFTFSFRVPAKQ